MHPSEIQKLEIRKIKMKREKIGKEKLYQQKSKLPFRHSRKSREMRSKMGKRILDELPKIWSSQN